MLGTLAMIFVFVSAMCFVLIFLSGRGSNLETMIAALDEQDYLVIPPTWWMKVRSYKRVDDSTGTMLFVQHDTTGFYACYYNSLGEFQHECFHPYATSHGPDDKRGTPAGDDGIVR